jgi:hypothetical protein
LVFNVIEGSIAVPAARLTADAVRGCVVIKCHASLIVRLALVGAAPVLLFDRWVKVFGDCLAAKAADDRSDGCTYNGTHWTCGDCACHGRSSDTSSGCAYPHAHRVRAGRAGDWVAIQRWLPCVVIHVCLRLYRGTTVRRE